jgi:hypothetical protein
MDLMTGIAAATKALEALKAIREIDKRALMQRHGKRRLPS